MSPTKYLTLSFVMALVLIATVVRAEPMAIDTNVAPAGCLDSSCPEYSCCDDKYRSKCCGPDGCILSGMCNDDCCGEVCRSEVEEVTEKKSCWKVECDKVCVPRVVCPWAAGGSGLTLFNCLKKKTGGGCGDSCGSSCGDCCDSCANGTCNTGCCLTPRCGDVRCVRVLDSESYEVTKCKCKWDLENGCGQYGPACGCGSQAGCRGDADCGDTCGCGTAAASVPSATHASTQLQGRQRIAQAFNVEQVSNELPVATAAPASTNDHRPSNTKAGQSNPAPKKGWSWWK